MARLISILSWLLLIGTTARAGGVTHMRIEGALDGGTLSHLRRAVEGAEERDDLLLVELDTPGGEIELMWQLARALAHASESGTTTVAWVNDRALSAGALVALACDRIVMRSRASIGAATAVRIGPTGLMPISADPGVQEKFNSAFRSQWRGWAEEHNRPGVLAEAMVDASVEVFLVERELERLLVSGSEWDDMKRRGEPVRLLRTICAQGQLLTLTGGEALELNLIDALGESLDEVLDKTGVSTGERTEVLRESSDEMAAWLKSYSLLLLAGGILFALIELKAPGFGLPGAASIACFGALLFGRHLIGLADVVHILAVGLGVVLIMVEIFLVPGTLWAGLSGGALILAGLILSGLGPGVGMGYALDRALLLDSASNVAGALLLGMIGLMILSRWLPSAPGFRRLVLTAPGANAEEGDRSEAPAPAHGSSKARGSASDQEALAEVGEFGRALTDLRPVGKVVLDTDPEREFEATCPGQLLDPGTRVRVVEVRSGRLTVEAL